MRHRTVLLLPLTLGLLTVAPGSAAAAQSACAPETGDWCTSVAKQRGIRFLELRTFSFTGTVRICVTPPTGASTCRTAALRATKDGLYVARRRWSTSFPRAGAGTYRVSFAPSVTGRRLGPVLAFRAG